MLNYTLYRIGQFIALSLPLEMAYLMAVIISDIHYIFAYKDRRAVKANLKVIFPEKTDREIRRIRIRMFRNFAKYLADFFRFSKIDKDYIQKKIKIENIEYFNQALSKNKGAIILTAHIGNWELGGVVTALLGYPLWAVAFVHKDKRVNDFFNFQRESKGMKVIPLGKAVRQCLNVLNKGEFVALAGDRDFTEKGAIVDFFGKPAFFPEGPAAFSLKTGAPIVPGFMVRNPDDSFTLKIEKAIEPLSGDNKNNDLRQILNQYKVIFEDYIRRYPDQWYMFKRFWKNS